jgi:hypothetical protein
MTTADWPGDFAVKVTVKDEAGKVLLYLPGFAGSGPLGERRLVREMRRAYEALARGVKNPEAYERMGPVMERVLKGKAARDVVEGIAYERWAWEGRGGGFADTVTPEGWQAFEERLPKAHKAAGRRGGRIRFVRKRAI